MAKVIDTPLPLDKTAVRNEVSIMNMLHHPKLINLHDAFEGDYDMILVLEMCAYYEYRSFVARGKYCVI